MPSEFRKKVQTHAAVGLDFSVIYHGLVSAAAYSGLIQAMDCIDEAVLMAFVLL